MILFGLHHAPKTSHVSRAYAFNAKRPTQEELRAYGGALSGDPEAVRAGDYAAQVKQLGARGRVRQIDSQGRCGRMRLWLYQDKVPPGVLATLFPGCRFVEIDPSAFRGRHGLGKGRKGLLESIAETLKGMPDDVEVVTLPELAELMGNPSLVKKAGRVVKLADDLKAIGWAVERGTRGAKGRPLTLRRINIPRT